MLALGTKNDASVTKQRCRDFGASGVAAYIMAAGDESGKREVCRGIGTRPKQTDAAKTRRRPELASASPIFPRGRYLNPIRMWYFTMSRNEKVYVEDVFSHVLSFLPSMKTNFL